MYRLISQQRNYCNATKIAHKSIANMMVQQYVSLSTQPAKKKNVLFFIENDAFIQYIYIHIHLNSTIQCNFLEHGCSFLITSRVPSKDELSDFIVNKDEKRVWQGTEPPIEPVYREQNINQRSRQEVTVCFIQINFSLLEWVHSESHIHARAVRQESRQCCFLKQSKDQDFVPVVVGQKCSQQTINE